MKQKVSFWGWLFYGSMAVLLFWAFLKSVGIINTPIWLEVGVPVMTLVLGGIGMYRDILDRFSGVTSVLAVVNEKVGRLERDVVDVKTDTSFLKKDFHRVDKDIGVLKANFA